MHSAALVLICIVTLAGLGYVRLLLKRRRRRLQRDERDQAEKRELSEKMINRLRDSK